MAQIVVPQVQPKKGGGLLAELLPTLVAGYMRSRDNQDRLDEENKRSAEAASALEQLLNPPAEPIATVEPTSSNVVPMAEAQPTPKPSTPFAELSSLFTPPKPPEEAQPPLAAAATEPKPAPAAAPQAEWQPGPEAVPYKKPVTIPRGFDATTYRMMGLNAASNMGTLMGKPAPVAAVASYDEQGNPMTKFVPKVAGTEYKKYAAPTVVSMFMQGEREKGITSYSQMTDDWNANLMKIRQSLPVGYQALSYLPGVVAYRGTDPKMPRFIDADGRPLTSDDVQSRYLALEEQKPVASIKSMQQRAPMVLDLIQQFREEMNQVGPSGLGPLAGRWNDYIQGKIGVNDPDYAALRTTATMLPTLVSAMHVGLRGAQSLQNEFKVLFDITHQPVENLNASLKSMERYATDLGQPRFSGGAGQPRTPGAPPAVAGGNAGAGAPATRRPAAPGGQGQMPAPMGGEDPAAYIARMRAAGFLR